MSLSPDALLANKVAFRSSDFEVVRSQIGRYFKPHKLRFLDENRRRLQTSLRRTNIGSISVNLLEYGGHVMVDPGALEDFYLIHVNLTGECEILHDGGHMTVRENKAAVCTPHRPYRFWWQPQSCVLALQIPRKQLLEHLRNITGVVPRREIDFDFALDLEDPQSLSLDRLIRFLVEDAGSDFGLTGDRLTAEPLERALMTALLKTQPGSHQEALKAAGGGAAPAHVVRAEALMRENIDRPLCLGDLALATSVSERTITEGFRRFRGTSPARYFLALRLAEAHRCLLAAPVTATVSDIAFALGFHHLSSFAAAYRTRYDETPSTTLKKAPVEDVGPA